MKYYYKLRHLPTGIEYVGNAKELNSEGLLEEMKFAKKIQTGKIIDMQLTCGGEIHFFKN